MKRSNDDVAAPVSIAKSVFLTKPQHEQLAFQRRQEDIVN